MLSNPSKHLHKVGCYFHFTEEVPSHPTGEWGSSGLNTAMPFLFPLHNTHSIWGGECRPVLGVESGEGHFGVYPACPPTASVPRDAPRQRLLAVRAPGFLAGGSSLPQSPACQASCTFRHEAGAQVGAMSQAVPSGLVASGTSSGGFNFLCCLPFSASISSVFLSPNRPTCAYFTETPPAVTTGGKGGSVPPGPFVTLLGFFFF